MCKPAIRPAPNALLHNDDLSRYCHIGKEPLDLLEQASKQLFLSPRACHRILKVSRTIADLDNEQHIDCRHVAEAIAFRRLTAESGGV